MLERQVAYWLAGDDHDAQRLWLTDDQIMRHATDPEGKPLPGLRIALCHHPLWDLADHARAQNLLAEHADLLLLDEAEILLRQFEYRFFERLRGMLGRVCLMLATWTSRPWSGNASPPLRRGERGWSRSADSKDLEAVEIRVLEQGAYYFGHIYRAAPEAARAALDALAQGRSPDLDPRIRRWLERRLLIDGEGRLRIPILGRWILAEIL